MDTRNIYLNIDSNGYEIRIKRGNGSIWHNTLNAEICNNSCNILHPINDRSTRKYDLVYREPSDPRDCMNKCVSGLQGTNRYYYYSGCSPFTHPSK